MIGCALIGLGMVSRTYAAALADLAGTVRLTGVHARGAAGRAAFAAAHPGLPGASRAYGSIAEIAADPEVGFVILATPPNARLAALRILMSAGKPVLMEKPVARNLAEAEAAAQLSAGAGIPLGIVLQHRARPVAGLLRARMAEIGAVEAVEIFVPWWRPQSYYDEPGRGSYARDGGGVLISQAIHTLDLALSFTGPVAQVTAMLATTRLHRMEAEDWASAGLRFASGAVGSLLATTAARPGRPEGFILHGAGGSAELVSGGLRLPWPDGRAETLGASAATGSGADPMAFTHAWHRDVIADFAAALREDRPPMVPVESALAVHRLIDALERSAREGRTLAT